MIRFVLCLDNRGYPVSLQVGRVYRRLPDAWGSRHGLVRVVDETGDDYLFERERFRPLRLATPVARDLAERLAADRPATPRTARRPGSRRRR